MTDRKKPGVAFWATVVVVAMPLLYVLSFGPACWAAHRGLAEPRHVSLAYEPLLALTDEDDPEWISKTLFWWATTCGGERGYHVVGMHYLIRNIRGDPPCAGPGPWP